MLRAACAKSKTVCGVANAFFAVASSVGDTQEIEKLLSELKKEEFLEVTRSGTLGMTKGSESLATNDQTKISYD